MPLTPAQQFHADIFRRALRTAETTMSARKQFEGPDQMKAEAIEGCEQAGHRELAELIRAGEFDKDFAGLFGHY